MITVDQVVAEVRRLAGGHMGAGLLPDAVFPGRWDLRITDRVRIIDANVPDSMLACTIDQFRERLLEPMLEALESNPPAWTVGQF